MTHIGEVLQVVRVEPLTAVEPVVELVEPLTAVEPLTSVELVETP